MTSVNWSSYAEVYDLMSASNPAYQDVVKLVSHRASQWRLNPNATVIELGAGTGNISLTLAQLFTSQHVVHVDSDPLMVARAKHKAYVQSVNNIEYLEQNVNTISFQPESLDAIVLVHALYTFQNPKEILTRCHKWLKLGGVLFVCDIGKALNVVDWAKYLLVSMTRDHGPIECFKRFYMGRAVASQNRRIAQSQREGLYWTHTLNQLEARVCEEGFSVSASGTCYRDYSNWLEAAKALDVLERAK